MSRWTGVKILWTLAAGLGAAGLATLMVTAPILSPSRDALYHLQGSSGPYIATVAILLLLAWVIAVACLLAADAAPVLSGRWLLALFYLGVIRLLLQGVVVLQEAPVTHTEKLGIIVLFALPLIALAGRWPAAFDRRSDDARKVLAFCAIFSVACLLQLGWVARESRNLNPAWAAAEHQAGTRSIERRAKVVWILFDELSYQQIYDRRAPGVALPEFDRLARQSVVFTQVKPAGYRTDRAVPSLMAGRRFGHLQSTAAGLPLLLPENSAAWERFEPRQTVLSDAEALGLKVEIVGWYNPYCRIFLGVVSACRWSNPEDSTCGIEPGNGIAANLQSVARWIFDKALFRRDSDAADSVKLRRDALQTLRSWSFEAVRNPQADMVFLHLPVPHPPGIRRRDGRAGPATYLDNLVVADRLLTELRQQMGDEWESSTVVVMGDHAWRTNLWRPTQWSDEEERASGGGFDDRPGYVVKMPGQQTGLRVDTSFDALRTREMFRRIFNREIVTAPDLLQWASIQPSAL